MTTKKEIIIACDSIPARCYTCGKLIGHLYQKYLELMEQKKNASGSKVDIEQTDNRDIIKKLGLESRYCCFMRLMTYPLGLYDYT